VPPDALRAALPAMLALFLAAAATADTAAAATTGTGAGAAGAAGAALAATGAGAGAGAGAHAGPGAARATPPAAPALTATPAPPLDAARIEAAAQALRADPLVFGSETTRSLRLKDGDEAARAADRPAGRSWFDGLADWLADNGRLLVWLAGALAVAVAAALLPRWWRLRGGAFTPLPDLPPTHVRTLDIRPDSLPADIGAAAAALLQQGDAVAALSLLYRGALSRLVHACGVPIRASSTEAECLALARPRVPAATQAYAAALVALWQRCVYRADEPPPAEVLALCQGFHAAWPAAEARP
jgi:hypothetical protein